MIRDDERMWQLLARHAHDVVAWQCLEPWGELWLGDDAGVGHATTKSAWIAAGAPWCPEPRIATTARAFVAAAHATGRRAAFFAVERLTGLEHFSATCIGEQAIFEPRRWPTTLAQQRRLREQLRRARKKGVRVRRVDADELHPGADLRRDVELLAAAWMRSRPLEPMSFLAAMQPFVRPGLHRYYLAEGPQGPLSLMSLVPVPARRGWLVEHNLRDPAAPNGTSELLLDAALREAVDDEFVSLGLLPLSGSIRWPLRVVRWLSAPLYDFVGLARFKLRLHPHRLQPVWLVHDGRPLTAIVDSLRAFADDRLLRFGMRSLLLRPNGICWLLAVTLAPWTVCLLGLLCLRATARLGFAPMPLLAWVLWDALLTVLLFRAARHPRRPGILLLAIGAALDAAGSLFHLDVVGFGDDPPTIVLRTIASFAPIGGTLLLLHAAARCGAGSRPANTRGS